ncbi:hypothetical protein GC163_04665 [bacterium]|nr:hypothetical protein [bacterium]
MATVFIPAELRVLTHGVSQLTVTASTVADAVTELNGQFPGIETHLIQGSKLRAGLMVSINGTFSSQGLRAPVTASDEIHFLPAIGGG